MKVCLVGSSGGHLTHLYMLKPFWKDKDRFWVTFDKEDARSLLEDEKMYPCYYPTNRSLKALIKNTRIAWKVLRKEKTDLIISCGAAVAVPFFYLGKLMGSKLIYIEVFDRIDKPTMTGKMVSLFEGLPLVAIEWQINGLPCILSDTITLQCAVTDELKFMSLDVSPYQWARRIIIDAKKNAAVRAEKSAESKEMVKRAGFDISENVKLLEKAYTE